VRKTLNQRKKMNIKIITDLITIPIEKVLNCIGSIINQSPGREELEKLKHSPLFNNPFLKKVKNIFEKKNEANHKRDHKAKGTFHADSQIFNKPRKKS